jgi:hypothetical protein
MVSRPATVPTASSPGRSHDYWGGVLDECGRFSLSGYLLAGVDESALMAAMPHHSYGTASVGLLVAAGFGVVPTTISLPRAVPAARFQPWHLSILLRLPVQQVGLRSNDERWIGVRDDVRADVESLMRLFEPRSRKPTATQQ